MKKIAPLTIKANAACLFLTLLSRLTPPLAAQGEYATENKKTSLDTDTEDFWAQLEPFTAGASRDELKEQLTDHTLGEGELYRVLKSPEFADHQYLVARDVFGDLIVIDREAGTIGFLTEATAKPGVMVLMTYEEPESAVEAEPATEEVVEVESGTETAAVS